MNALVQLAELCLCATTEASKMATASAFRCGTDSSNTGGQNVLFSLQHRLMADSGICLDSGVVVS